MQKCKTKQNLYAADFSTRLPFPGWECPKDMQYSRFRKLYEIASKGSEKFYGFVK